MSTLTCSVRKHEDYEYPVFNIGDDELDYSGDIAKPDWVAIEYTSHDSEGDGEAVVRDGDWLYLCGLGHCSCYGPWDGNLYGEACKVHINQWHEADDHVIGFTVSDRLSDLVDRILYLQNQPRFGHTGPCDETCTKEYLCQWYKERAAFKEACGYVPRTKKPPSEDEGPTIRGVPIVWEPMMGSE